MRRVTVTNDESGRRFICVTKGYGPEFAEMMHVFGLAIKPALADELHDCFECVDPSQVGKIDCACKLWRERTIPPSGQ